MRNPFDWNKFENAVSIRIISSENLNDREGSAKQIVLLKIQIFDLRNLSKFESDVRVSRVIHPERHFVVLALRAFHRGFNSGKSVAKDTNFAAVL